MDDSTHADGGWPARESVASRGLEHLCLLELDYRSHPPQNSQFFVKGCPQDNVELSRKRGTLLLKNGEIKMKKSIFIMAIATLVGVLGHCFGQESSPNQSPNTELSERDKELIRHRIDRIVDKDQQFRSYLNYGTIDEAEIKRIEKLDAKEQLAAMTKNRGILTDEIKKFLTQLQLKNDRENWAEFLEIVEKHGYPSPERIGVETDRLFVLLLHPPVGKAEVESHVAKLSAVLKPEVLSGRMKPKFFAMFVDNMHVKILRRPQLYGTNQMFDPETKAILAPMIEDLAKANRLRREIGMPELKEGEYRLAKTNN